MHPVDRELSARVRRRGIGGAGDLHLVIAAGGEGGRDHPGIGSCSRGPNSRALDDGGGRASSLDEIDLDG